MKYISFRDSTLTLLKERVIDICEDMIDARLDIKWNCNSRANEVDRSLLKIMREAGCESIQYGIECGNADMLKKFKRLDRDIVADAVSMTKRSGIRAHGYFMLGLPGETMKTIRETIDFAKSLPLYSAGFTTATPFPGSELWDYSLENNLIVTKDFSRYDLKNIPVTLYPNLKPDEILGSQKRAFREFYLRPKILAYHLSSIKNFNDLRHYINEALINLK